MGCWGGRKAAGKKNKECSGKAEEEKEQGLEAWQAHVCTKGLLMWRGEN